MALWDRHFRQPYLRSTSDEYIERLVTSWLFPPTFLFALRLFLSLYVFVATFFILGWYDTHDDNDAARLSFSYFTVLNYWGLAFYFAFSAAHTGSYAFRGRAWLQNWPSLLKWLHSGYYSIITVYPIIVTGVFWGVLAANAYQTEFSTWSNISQHALNTVFAGLEIILVRSDPHPPINVLLLIVILALYLGLAYLTYDTQHVYVYSFLDPAKGRGRVAGACIGILAATIFVFFIVSAFIWFRRWLTEKKLGMTGKLSTRSPKHVSGRQDVEALELTVKPKTSTLS